MVKFPPPTSIPGFRVATVIGVGDILKRASTTEATPLNAVQEMGAWEPEGMARRYAPLAPAHFAPHAEIVANLLSGANPAQPPDDTSLVTR